MTSMHNPTTSHVPVHPGLVLLAAKPTKDIHHSAFAGVFKGAQGDVLGLGQQGFGFSHFSLFVEVSVFSVASLAFNRTQSLLQKVVPL